MIEQSNSDDELMEKLWYAPIAEFQRARDDWLSSPSSTRSPLTTAMLIEKAKSFLGKVRMVRKCQVFDQSGNWKGARLPRIENLPQKCRREYFVALLSRVTAQGYVCEPISSFYDTSTSRSRFQGMMALFYLIENVDIPRVLMIVGSQEAWAHTIEELARMTIAFIEHPPIQIAANGNPDIDLTIASNLCDVEWWSRYAFYSFVADKSLLRQLHELDLAVSLREFVSNLYKNETARSVSIEYDKLASRFSSFLPSPTWLAWMRVVHRETFQRIGRELLEKDRVGRE